MRHTNNLVAALAVVTAFGCADVAGTEADSEDAISASTGFATNRTVLVTATATESPPSITLQFPMNRVTSETCLGYDVHRKERGQDGWTKLTPSSLPCDTTSFTQAVQVGDAYEYMVERHNRIPGYYDESTHEALLEYCATQPEDPFCDFDAMCASDPYWCDFMVPAQEWRTYGFVYAGVAVPAVHDRGTMILVVDETVAGPLSYELDRLQRDLTGDGWQVVRHDFARGLSLSDAGYGAQVRALKSLIVAEYEAAPDRVRSVLLFGHLPVAYSGGIFPDGHVDHRGAWPTDSYYGDVDYEWTDDWLEVENRWSPRQVNMPGDGKFDHSTIPSDVELAVGRIDLSSLPLFEPMTEVDLLRRYLDKHHAFRTGTKTFEPRALMSTHGDRRFTVRYALDDLHSYFGLDGIDAATASSVYEDSWLATAEAGSYLWGYAGDSGHWRGMYHLGWAEEWKRDINVAFLRLYGSYFGDWDYEDAFLRAPIAGPSALVSFWDLPLGGNRNWFFHMALGGTVGESMRFAQNASVDYPRLQYGASIRTEEQEWVQFRRVLAESRSPMQRPIYVSLMGDPSLRMLVVDPPADVRAVVDGGAVDVSWIPTTESLHYVYRAPTIDGPFELLTPTPISGTTFRDETPASGTMFYAVKAAKLETTASGTFWNTSTAQRSQCGDLGACRIERPNVAAVAGGLVADVFVVGAVVDVRLEIIDRLGRPYAHLGWDTDPGTRRPSLEVFEDGDRLLRADGTMRSLPHGPHQLGLIASAGARFQGRLVRVVATLDDGTELTSPVVWFGPVPAVSVSVSPISMQVDHIGPGDGFAAPDGAPDGVFGVQYEGPVQNVALVGVSSSGGLNMWAYDTVVGPGPIPAGLGNYPSGAHTWTLGVEVDGTMQNAQTGALPSLPWVRGLTVYATQTAFLQGRDWKLVIQLPDGSVTESDTFRY